MVKRSYDDLSDAEKNKFLVFNLWSFNQLFHLSWYFFVIVVLIMVCFAFMILGSTVYTYYTLGGLLLFSGLFLFKCRRINKLSRLVFNVDDDDFYLDFFGIDEKELRFSFRELLNDLEKMQMKGRNQK